MSSANIRSVAADSNVLLSAIAGRAARRVFAAEDIVIVTTEMNEQEVEEYIPYFAERYGLAEEILSDAFALLPVQIFSEHEYSDHLPAARRLLSARDVDDVALAALALKLRIPIWSNDKDYEAFPMGVFTTAQLLKMLGV